MWNFIRKSVAGAAARRETVSVAADICYHTVQSLENSKSVCHYDEMRIVYIIHP